MLKRISLAFVVVLFVGFTSACNQISNPVNLITTTNLATQADQQRFLQDATPLNKDASKNMALDGTMSSNQGGQTINFDFKANTLDSNSEVIMSVNDKKIVMIQIGDAAYMGDGVDKWIKVEGDMVSQAEGLQTDEILAFENQINANDFTYKGVMDCNGSKCQVFGFNKEGEKSTVYFDGSSKLVRIIDFESAEGAKGKLNVNYGNEKTVVAPENAQVVEGLEGLGLLMEIYGPFFEEAGVNFGQ